MTAPSLDRPTRTAAEPPATAVAPYLMFDGTAREAMAFYQACLGGEVSISTYGETPPGEGPEPTAEGRDRVMHAALTSGSLRLMASDTPPGEQPSRVGDNVHLSLDCASAAALDRLYAALGEGGRATMPPNEVFWGGRFGMLVDRFGIHWMLSSP